MHAAFVEVEKYWPTVDLLPASVRVVDIGAGLGMYHIFLRQLLRSRGKLSHHYVFDRDATGSVIGLHAGFHSSTGTFPFYSSLACATDIAHASGFRKDEWSAINASRDALLGLGEGSVDIVISLVSWGFHYPVNTYAEEVKAILKPRTGRLIITPKLATGQHRSLIRAGFNCSYHPCIGRRRDGSLAGESKTAPTMSCCVGCKGPFKPDRQSDQHSDRGAGEK